jgi:thiol-disulfide isomerase/thioredoxin
MTPLERGDPAPAILGADGPTAVVFYKVTCPTCQMAAPAMERLHRAYADRFVAVVQDPPEEAETFAREHGVTFPATTDEPPFELSRAFEIEVVPTVVVIADGRIEDVAESWDRLAWNRAAARLGELLGTHAVPVSDEGDGLPPFRPG